MTGLAIVMVLASAFLHATWNLLAKRAGGGAALVWLYDAMALVLYLPVALLVVFLARPNFGLTEVVFMLGSALLHLGYFLLLQRGYQVGDLSLVYPLARGTGPVLSTTIAIAFFGERPSGLAVLGVLLVAGRVLLLGGGTCDGAGK